MKKTKKLYIWRYCTDCVLLLDDNYGWKDQMDFNVFVDYYKLTGKKIELNNEQSEKIMAIIDWWPFGNVTLQECKELKQK